MSTKYEYWSLDEEIAEPDPELSVDPVYGFRAWKVDEANNLTAYYDITVPWPTFEPMVSHHASTSACKPGAPCRNCGIYAFQRYDHLAELMHKNEREFQRSIEVRGIVAAWGDIRVTERGFRAGTAYPVAFLEWAVSPLYVANGINLHCRFYKTASKYGVPVVYSVDELVETAREQGCVPCSN